MNKTVVFSKSYAQFAALAPVIVAASVLLFGLEAAVATEPSALHSGTIKIHKHSRFCSFLGHSDMFGKRLPMYVSRSEKGQSDVSPMIALIQDYSGVRSNLEVYSGRAINAAAVLFPDEHDIARLRRAIIYHPQFVSYLNKKTKVRGQQSPWAARSVFAHEVGHHLAGHTLQPDSQRHFELQADWYSGFILGRMGASLSSALQTLRTFWIDRVSPTHPGSPARLAAISDGWRQSKCERDSNAQSCHRNLAPVKPAAVEKDPDLLTVKPKLMCKIGGESMAVGVDTKNSQDFYWLRHYSNKPTRIGMVSERSGNCRYRMTALLSGVTKFDLCAMASSQPKRMTVFAVGKGGKTEKVGMCTVCEKGSNRLNCPINLS